MATNTPNDNAENRARVSRRTVQHATSGLIAQNNERERERAVHGIVRPVVRELIARNGAANSFVNARVVNAPGDGSCLFFAIAASSNPALNPVEWGAIAKKYRTMAVEYACEHLRPFLTHPRAYCEKKYMLSPTEYGGDVEIGALSKVLERPIELYYELRPGIFARDMVYGPEFKKAPVHLLYNGINHYDALVDVEQIPGKVANVAELKKIKETRSRAKMQNEKAHENRLNKVERYLESAPQTAAVPAAVPAAVQEQRNEIAQQQQMRYESQRSRGTDWVSAIDGETAITIGGAMVAVGSFICTSIAVFR